MREFQDRDDDLTIYLQQFKTSTTFLDANVLQKLAGGRSDDEFVRKLIEFETTDWIREAINAREGKREAKNPSSDHPRSLRGVLLQRVHNMSIQSSVNLPNVCSVWKNDSCIVCSRQKS